MGDDKDNGLYCPNHSELRFLFLSAKSRLKEPCPDETLSIYFLALFQAYISQSQIVTAFSNNWSHLVLGPELASLCGILPDREEPHEINNIFDIFIALCIL